MFWKRTPLATAKSLITKWKFQIPLFFSNFWLMINILCVSKKLGPPPSKKNIFLWNKETSSLSLSLSIFKGKQTHGGTRLPPLNPLKFIIIHRLVGFFVCINLGPVPPSVNEMGTWSSLVFAKEPQHQLTFIIHFYAVFWQGHVGPNILLVLVVSESELLRWLFILDELCSASHLIYHSVWPKASDVFFFKSRDCHQTFSTRWAPTSVINGLLVPY